MSEKPVAVADMIFFALMLVILNGGGSLAFWAAEERWPALASFRPAATFLCISASMLLFSTLAPTARTKVATKVVTGTLFVAATILAAIQFV